MDNVYRRVMLEQGTSEWQKWRNSGIGASDAPVIMNENPWKSLAELLNEKRANGGRPMNQAMARGVELEPAARAAYCAKLGKTVEAACLESIVRPWMRASVDGLSICGNHLVEIKCGESVYRKTAASGYPPRYYYGQLQHALAVTGLSVIDFWCFLPRMAPLHVEVTRDEPYIKKLIIAEELLFEQHLRIGSVGSLTGLI